MPSNLLCAMGEQGAHSLAEGPGLGCNLLHYPPPPSTPVPCPELTLPVLLLLCSALWSFKEGRKGHLLSLFAQPRHKTWQRLVTHSRLLSLFSRVRSEDVPPNPGAEAEELRAWARRCPRGAAASSVLPPPHSLHLAASREVGLRVPGVLSWGQGGTCTQGGPAHPTTSLAGKRLRAGLVIWRRQESSGALPSFPQSRRASPEPCSAFSQLR